MNHHTLLFFVVLLFVLGVIEGALGSSLVRDAWANLQEWRRGRDVVRRSAVEQELQARRWAQQLSLLAWKARHQMYDVMEETDHPDTTPYPTNLSKRQS